MPIADRLAVALVAFVLLNAALTADAVATQSPDRTALDSCATITEPGVYELTADVETTVRTCVEIRASDVVFDGGDHRLAARALESESVGVAVAGPVSNVTVRDVGVTGWTYGFRAANASNVAFRGVAAERTINGISLYDSERATVADATASNNFVGVFVSRSQDVAVRNLTADWNSFEGLLAVESSGLRMSNATATRNDVGVAFRDVNDSTVVGLNVTGNRQTGVASVGSNVELTNVTVATETTVSGWVAVAAPATATARW